MKCSLCCGCFRNLKEDQNANISQELTKDAPIFGNNTIEELKLKIGKQDILDSDSTENMIPESQKTTPQPPVPTHLSEEGLIIPRKLPNPMLESTERQNLHREMLFNQKIGKNVLNQKTELQRALEKHKENVAKKEIENNIGSIPHELEKVIADRAKRLQDANNVDDAEDEKALSKEFIEARAKLRTRTESK